MSCDLKRSIHVLCQLALNTSPSQEAVDHLAELNHKAREEFLALADSHHVIIRSFSTVIRKTNELDLMCWAANAISDEQARIDNGLSRLTEICDALEKAGCPVTVMKSLDHWPDLGNDLDLFTIANENRIAALLTSRFKARVEPRSWGDRLANKWNFAIPGLKEVVEIHSQRLGQTGEHTRMARRFITRRVPRQFGRYTFLVPAPEERVIVSTLQRMYRHFYFRVCDIVDTSALVQLQALDYGELESAASEAGIWPGVVTFLVIVSDYVQKYCGRGLELPVEIRTKARFNGEKVTAQGKFLRVPIMPYGAALYTSQVTRTALRGDFPATFRLSLLPPLASAAAVAYRLTGSDKGVW